MQTPTLKPQAFIFDMDGVLVSSERVHWKAYRDTFAAEGEELVHHAGHAIGLGHPEAPELVLESDRTIESGMVLTLEPGIYGKPTGGIRLEHDYLITDDGFERLSNHELGLA